MRRLLIKPQARLDLLEIWHFIAHESVPAANHVGEELEKSIQGLLEMPARATSATTCAIETFDSGVAIRT